MSFQCHIGVLTDAGRKRSRNEDSVAVESDLGLFMVADGVGGRRAGDVASQMAIAILTHHMQHGTAPLVHGYQEAFSAESNRLIHGIQLANMAIYKAGQQQPEYHGMATTLAAMYCYGDVVSLAHVGDSRVYRWRGGCLECLTVDHVLVDEPGDFVAQDEAADRVYKHALTQALGAEDTVVVDASEWVVLDRDRFLLCTDGLTHMVDEAEVARIISNSAADPQKICQTLIDTANARGGTDNITVILIVCHKNTRPTSRVVARVVLLLVSKLRKIYRSLTA